MNEEAIIVLMKIRLATQGGGPAAIFSESEREEVDLLGREDYIELEKGIGGCYYLTDKGDVYTNALTDVGKPYQKWVM